MHRSTILVFVAFLATLSVFASIVFGKDSTAKKGPMDITELLPPLSDNPFESMACDAKMTFRTSKKGKKGDIVVKMQGKLMFTQTLEMGQESRKKSDSQFEPVLWCDGAIHIIADPLSFAGYSFEPKKNSTLTFRVELAKGYVFQGGNGKVRTHKGEIIELDPTKNGVVIGSPAKGSERATIAPTFPR
jgi:hypothetical protein